MEELSLTCCQRDGKAHPDAGDRAPGTRASADVHCPRRDQLQPGEGRRAHSGPAPDTSSVAHISRSLDPEGTLSPAGEAAAQLTAPRGRTETASCSRLTEPRAFKTSYAQGVIRGPCQPHSRSYAGRGPNGRGSSLAGRAPLSHAASGSHSRASLGPCPEVERRACHPPRGERIWEETITRGTDFHPTPCHL